MVVRDASEGKEGIWTRAKARSSAKHMVQECQQTPLPPGAPPKRRWKEKGIAGEGNSKENIFKCCKSETNVYLVLQVQMHKKQQPCR